MRRRNHLENYISVQYASYLKTIAEVVDADRFDPLNQVIKGLLELNSFKRLTCTKAYSMLTK